MPGHQFDASFGANPAENYERYFVPVIGGPLARRLVARAALRPGERVLDVACGTGVVARLAAEQVGTHGQVAGVDLNPAMLAVARSAAPAAASIQWHEANAEALPLPDGAFDAVLCSISLQFVPDRRKAVDEMRRVLAEGGRLTVGVPGPEPALFTKLAGALTRHVGPEAAGFVHLVFSLADPSELRRLVEDAGFRDAAVETSAPTLRLPPAKEFLWQYVYSTPLAGLVGRVDEAGRERLERDVVEEWREFGKNGGLSYEQPVIVASASR